jgi:hypothetical protein
MLLHDIDFTKPDDNQYHVEQDGIPVKFYFNGEKNTFIKDAVNFTIFRHAVMAKNRAKSCGMSMDMFTVASAPKVVA